MYAVYLGICVACRSLFQFNAHLVPALVIDGERHAVCRACAERWNALHPEKARPILPGAYEPEGDGALEWIEEDEA